MARRSVKPLSSLGERWRGGGRRRSVTALVRQRRVHVVRIGRSACLRHVQPSVCTALSAYSSQCSALATPFCCPCRWP